MPHQKVRRIVAAAVVAATPLVYSFDANAACNVFVISPKQYVIQQSNRFTVTCSMVGGGATALGHCSSGATGGTANGWIKGRSFTLRITWGQLGNSKSIGYYTGTINDGGWIENGRTYDEKSPRNWAMWWFTGTPLTCVG